MKKWTATVKVINVKSVVLSDHKRGERKNIMAKRSNLLTVIKGEIEKGNTVVTKEGVLLKEDAVEKRIENSFISSLKTHEIPMNMTFDDYRKKELDSYIKLTDILEQMIMSFGLNFPADTDASKPAENDSELSEPAEERKAKQKRTSKKKTDGDV